MSLSVNTKKNKQIQKTKMNNFRIKQGKTYEYIYIQGISIIDYIIWVRIRLINGRNYFIKNR